jgi:cell division protease FtsH
VKVTIVPRGQSLGAAWYLPEERTITTTEQILDQMCSALGGRAAEEVIFGRISTGALSDLEKVTKQAYAMVSIYGLNKRVGNISYYDSQGRDMFTKPYSEDTAKIIDEEVSKLIEGQYQRAVEVLKENKEKLEELANKLLTSEVIFKEDLEAIFGKRIWDKEEPKTEEIEAEIISETTTSLPPSEQATESPSEIVDDSAEQKEENGNEGESNESPKE